MGLPQVPGALPSLRVLAMPGYVGLPAHSLLALGTPPLITLDLRAMRFVRPATNTNPAACDAACASSHGY